MNAYRKLVAGSIVHADRCGITDPILPDAMRHHQREATIFALAQGRAALFLDTGLGKTLCIFAWAFNVARETGKPVIIFAPLGVLAQHKAEAERFGYEVAICRSQLDVPIGPAICLANYDRLDKFDARFFGGIALDESSIIKNFSGVTTKKLMEFAESISFRLCCSATPAPNDHMELGQHAQFLGVMTSSEMLSRWFIVDQSEMGRYRLKRHAVNSFWSWLASWARCCERPSDLGGDDTGYILPELQLQRHVVRTDITANAGEKNGQGLLFRLPSASATSIHAEKRLTASDRAAKIAGLVLAEPDEAWIIWCETDYDAEAIMAMLPGAEEVHGSMSPERKEKGLNRFSVGDCKWLVTKASIAGWGLNWQHCARVAFVGLSFSYEGFYQAVRRCWRYGQSRSVHAHVACAETEETIWQTIVRKRDDHDQMKIAMRAAMSRAIEVRSTKLDYQPKKKAALPPWLTEAA